MVNRKFVPVVQREEQHINQTQVVPSTQTQMQNIVRKKYLPTVQREEQHVNQTQVVP